MFPGVRLTSAGRRGGAAVHLGRVRGAAAVHGRLAELDVAADGVGHHGGHVGCCGLSEKSGVSVARTGGRVAHGARAHIAILHRAAVHGVRAEDLGDAALGRVRHSVLSMADLVELDMLELSVGGHCGFM